MPFIILSKTQNVYKVTSQACPVLST